MALSATQDFDASAPWALSDQVSLRDETFGALACHHGNRRFVFLKSRELVTLVRSLGDFKSADAAVKPEQHAQYVTALSSLVKSEILGGC